jgi:hypothetical protein
MPSILISEEAFIALVFIAHASRIFTHYIYVT